MRHSLGLPFPPFLLSRKRWRENRGEKDGRMSGERSEWMGHASKLMDMAAELFNLKQPIPSVSDIG